MIEQIGDWVVEERLGVGGMGSVYKCRHRLSEQVRAAVKLLRIDPDTTENQQARFLQEAELLHQIQHPGVPKLRHPGIDDQHGWYLAIELIEGQTLARRLKRGPLSAEQVTALLGQMADILVEIHGRGLFHRDIKPANIMWTDAQRYVLLDFGIAIIEGKTRLTVDGALGTPSYMAPEVLQSAETELDLAALDLYSLGIVACEALIGKTPFSAPAGLSAKQRYANIITQKLSRDLIDVPSAPPALRRLLKRLTARNPGMRPASARALLDEVRAIERSGQQGRKTKGRGKSSASSKSGASSSSSAPRRAGRDIQLLLRISPTKAAKGCKERLTFERSVPCRACQQHRGDCSGCHGTGQHLQQESIRLTIPAGSQSGQRLRVRGKGDAGQGGAPAGNLYVEIYIAEPYLHSRDHTYPPSDSILGIDLGTTSTTLSLMSELETSILTNKKGERSTPTVIGFKNQKYTHGTTAKKQAITNPAHTIFSLPQLLGRSFREWQQISGKTYEIAQTGDGVPLASCDQRYLSPTEIAALFLTGVIREAEERLGRCFSRAVLTVPASFDDVQRAALRAAVQQTELDVARVIDAPTAAALAYGFNKEDDHAIAVYDFGGGTFDVSVFEIGSGVIEVKSTSGSAHLGGNDVDQVLIDWMLKTFKADTGIDISEDKGALQRLKDAAEKAKIELSTAQSTAINLPFLTADFTGPKHFKQELSRARFEQMIDPVISQTLSLCHQALKDANLRASEIDEVILVGGSTRIPLVQKKVEALFGKAPNHSVNPDEAVAVGAAIQGGVLSGDVTDVLLLDFFPLSLGIETLGGVNTVLIPRNTTIPTKKSEIFSTAVDNQSAAEIRVYQGERAMARDNRLLGVFRLDGIPAAPRGEPELEVTVEIDANAIVNVTAKDRATGTEQKITIRASPGLIYAPLEDRLALCTAPRGATSD